MSPSIAFWISLALLILGIAGFAWVHLDARHGDWRFFDTTQRAIYVGSGAAITLGPCGVVWAAWLLIRPWFGLH